MKKNIILFTLLLSSLVQAQEIKEGALTNRDIMDALDMKAWVWDVENAEGFTTIEVDVEAHQRNKGKKWKEPDVAGHSMVYSEKKTQDRVVLTIHEDRIHLKVGNAHGWLSIDLSDYKLERPAYVGNEGQMFDGGFIIMSQSIKRNTSREPIETKDFYLIVKITTE